MKYFCRATLWALAGVWVCGAAAEAGIVVPLKDPRYFERQQQVIFPDAEVKLVAFEFEAVGNDERGKERAKELHKEFLANINDVQGGAIITYVTVPGQRIENYRVNALEAAKQQKAQMVLWGRILADKGSSQLINARLMLVSPPPGVSADYVIVAPASQGKTPVEVRGVIDAPVTQLRVDFNTVENDVTPLAFFLSGLARYYKGAVRQADEAKRWLRSSIDDFKRYVAEVPEKLDRAALSQANLYLSRAYIRLADADPQLASGSLRDAQAHAERAARLNPYDPAVPTVQAAIAVKQRANISTARGYLARAVELAPGDTNAHVNLAVIQSAEGNVAGAIGQLDKANFIQKVQKKELVPAVQKLRKQFESYQDDKR